ncbi:amidohydrolase family protein [Pseudonocardia sp. ICBG1293]|uniref:amidohydrolase family protein n=1 Tax=Pseudonocardia sp. ICBG1293 TaxID=2844382 RepID=UPI001CCCAF7C|nr:amidohydrolase family protein [Pseudonocardia sp. ICBG1293]
MDGGVVLTDVRVFDGGTLGEPVDVAVADGRIAASADGARTVDGRGAVLLPGLIDAHVHVGTVRELQAYGRWGVTSVLDMGAPDWAATSRLRGRDGLADLRSAGTVACAPRGAAVARMGYPASGVVRGPSDARRFVADRIADGVDHIKIVLEERLPFRPRPLDEATTSAVVTAAHEAGVLVCVHATSTRSFRIATRAGADVLTHAPLAAPLEEADAGRIADRGLAVAPTLVMMKKLVERFPAPVTPRRISYAHPADTVRTLRRAGVTVLAGTDANSDPAAPNTVEHGAALHDELQLLVEAGLTPAEALTAATSAPARVFGLSDRGRIRQGYRADLLLVDGDPTVDIAATRNIRGVWIAGQEVR